MTTCQGLQEYGACQRVDGRGSVGHGSNLGFDTIVSGMLPGMWQMLGLGRCNVLEALEGARNVTGHGDVAGTFCVIPPIKG